MKKRAGARFSDKARGPKSKARLRITRPEFIDWYMQQSDQCAYCGL